MSDSARFRAEREAEWARLDAIVTKAEKRSVRRLTDEELFALPLLYRTALSSLSMARETSLDLALVTYLEGLCARAYFFVYGVRTAPGRRLAAFFGRDWPQAVRSLWRETLLALAVTVMGLAGAYLMVAHDHAWYDVLMPGDMAQGRDFSASTDALRQTLYHKEGPSGLSMFASMLFTHNTQVSVMSFALGFAFGVPTVLLILYNGTTLGAMLALFFERGLGFEFAGWLMIHGTTEFFAIILSGAAGFRIGWSMIFPGELTRLEAATAAGRIAGQVMIGVVLMLACAGILEGLGRQLITVDLIRYAIGIVMLMLWLAYFYLPRGSRS